MLNLLIVENNIEHCKKLISELCALNTDLRFCAIANDVTEMKTALDTHSIDMILINIKLFQNIINNRIFDITKYMNSIILFSENIDIENLKNTLNKFTSSRSLSLDSNSEKFLIHKILSELHYIGYNSKYNGTKYLADAIYLIYTDKDYSDDNLEKDIYPIIAQKYDKSVNNIKCNIINATDNMFYECKEEVLMNYIGFHDASKPGPKTIMFSVLNKL